MIYVVGLKNESNIKSIFVNEIIFNEFSINDDFSVAIFTSKNAVKACEINNINLKNKKIFSIGSATTNYLNEIGLNVFYTGSTAHASEFKYEILPLLKSEKCVYFKALQIISDLDEFLYKNNIDLRCVVSYFNHRLKAPLGNDFMPFNEEIKEDDILIFLAPSGVRDFAYFYDFFPKNIIAIGKSTQKALSDLKINSIIPAYPTLDECLKLAQDLKKLS